MNPYESPTHCEPRDANIDLTKVFFALMLGAFLLLVPTAALAAWIGFHPGRLVEYLFVVPLIGILLLVGIFISAAGAFGRHP